MNYSMEEAKKQIRRIQRRIPIPDCHNPERYVPYRLLWAKVIIRAAYDYALWKESKDLRLKKYSQEAERWLFEPSTMEFGFESICFKFNFPMDKIREKARKLTKDDVKKLEFRERHGKNFYLHQMSEVEIDDDGYDE